jgi:hypothetical protein
VKKEKVIEQLESLKVNSKEFMDSSYDDIWSNDIIALDYAIKKVKKDKSYMGSYWQGAWHMFLLVFLIKVIDVLMTISWG